jgi:putative colanic acid biosysnthesis UDP-glucose lipid carrier transferase
MSVAVAQSRSKVPVNVVSDSVLKRLIDVVLAFGILVFILPLMLLVIVAIRLDSPGPIFFRQRRTGLNGRQFRIFKFRSMTVLEDGDQIKQAMQDDDRVTRVGGFLRRSSIDELPQLLNVLAGDMSLVGPRPHALAHDEHFAALVPDYKDRFRARPGITGLAQVNGLRGEIRAMEDMVRRIELDNLYIENWSIWRDLGILVKTLVVLPFHRNAY